jgi:signal transduction histidine kinase
LVTAFVFLLGALASGLLVARRLTSPISALNYFEHALIETSQNSAAKSTQLPLSLPEQNSPIFQAYNTLVSRLQESESTRLDSLAKIVHNFRSPLASIAGYAEMMSSPTLRPADADLEVYARVITREAKRLGQMVEQVVTAVLIDDGQLDLTMAPVQLGPLLAEVVAEAKTQSQRDVILEDHLTPAIISCDALYMRQVFRNLIDNGLKYSPPNLPVQVRLRRAQTPGRAEIVVADQGIGIAEANLRILFTRFGRILNGRTRGISGSGLGLYIAKYIVDQHHGDITVHSRTGQGTTFVVTLPFGDGVP